MQKKCDINVISNDKYGENTSPPNDSKHSSPKKLALQPEELEELRSKSPSEVEIEYKGGGCSKYSDALKVILPFRPPRKDKSKLPANKAGLFSFISLTWMTEFMWKAYKKGLEPSDLWHLHEEDSARVSCSRIQRLWREEKLMAKKSGRSPALWKSVWRSARTRILVSLIVSLMMNFLQFLGPSVLVKLTLDYINESHVNHLYAAKIVGAVLLVNIARGALFNMMFNLSTHTAARMCGGIQSMIFGKILKLKTGGEKFSAQITNIITNDSERLFESCLTFVFLTASPALFVMSAVYSFFVIGPWALAGMGVYLLFYPVMGLIAKLQSGIRLKTVKKTDKRVALMTEILNSLRLIKMYAWEEPFANKIAAIRKEEMERHRLGALLQAVSSTTVPSISILATMSSLLGATLTGYPLTASGAFTIYSVFTQLQFTMGVLPFTVRSIAEAKISLARVQNLLELPEHKKGLCGLMSNQLALTIKNAGFAWEINSIDLKSPTTSSKAMAKSKSKANGSVISTTNANNSEKAPMIDQRNVVTISPTSPSSPNNSPTKCASPSKASLAPILDGSVELIETLFGINLSVEKGKLIGICGSIGSGKSSLLSAICGDMKLQNGQLQVNGRLALVPQQAWIYNSSFRENILIGLPYEAAKYKKVIEVCSLQPDLDLLPNGDLTEIGERGVNLSGGQKQRVNLARAVYGSRDIYLLDDPISAVDSKVAKALFSNCIKGHLKGKTVILVTHRVHFLEKCDEIVLMKNGRICERGSHESLMTRKGQYFELAGFEFSQSTGSEAQPTQAMGTDETKYEVDENGGAKYDGKLIKEETKQVGSVSKKVYLTSIRVCGGWCVCLLILLAIFLFTLARIFDAVWLQRWFDAGDGLEEERRANATLFNVTLSDDQMKGSITLNPNLWIYQLVYGLSFLFLIATGVVKGVGLTFRVLAGASKLHHDMFHSVMRTPMTFLNTTPTARILNRFSRDMDEIDVRVPFFLEMVSQGFLGIIAQIVMGCIIFPIFTAPLLVVTVLFIWIDMFFNAGIRECKRLDNNLKSPVLQQIAASISGLSLIRTLDREEIFMERFNNSVDTHTSALLVFKLSNRWFSYRMDVMGVMVTTAITTICVFTKGSFSTAMAGLAITAINGVCGFIPFLMRLKSELQARLTSVERIIEYAYELESEAPLDIPATKPPSSWPSSGAVEMHRVKLRYRPELPLVLHGVTASIRGSEKIGIVGRTGAGKSSLISTLLRMLELDDGWIKIDGVDISKIGLHTLRSAISVIPQDAVLFQGSIRYNLDPFDEHTDESVWLALERSHLKKVISKLPSKLSAEVEAAGENFSVGERQLICLARALLRSSKILLLDEATASVDIETDHLIQKTIKEAFHHCTVLTIAHRLNTVVDYDRIMVLDNGMVVEFASAEELMTRETSLFKDMMSAIGIHDVDQMKNLT